MNLLQLRTKFRQLSGRFDLVNSDFTDNGADFFINSGRKFLDRLDETQKSWGSCFRFILTDFYSASVPECRAIKEVWAATTIARWQLIKMDLNDLINDYLLGEPDARTSGVPLYYTPTITRHIPQDATPADFEAFLGFVEVPTEDVHNYNTILLNVPTSEKIMVEVKGLYYSFELSDDTDENYWSSQHPMLLYMAAMRYAEVANRNTQGVKDWETAIGTEMRQLGMDLVEELISEITQIED